MHIAAFALGAGIAWLAFKRELSLIGTAFALFGAAELNEHLTLTAAEVVARLNHDWSADVAAYDRNRHALGMADALSTGIVKQFPRRFRRDRDRRAPSTYRRARGTRHRGAGRPGLPAVAA